MTIRLRARHAAVAQAVRFAAVGTAGTALQLALYGVTTSPLGATDAAVLSWVVSTLATNLAHRAVTFRTAGQRGALADQLVAFATCLIGLLLTTAVAQAIPTDDSAVASAALVGANVLAGVARFLVLHWWAGRHQVTTGGAERVKRRRGAVDGSIHPLRPVPAPGMTDDTSGTATCHRRQRGTTCRTRPGCVETPERASLPRSRGLTGSRRAGAPPGDAGRRSAQAVSARCRGRSASRTGVGGRRAGASLRRPWAGRTDGIHRRAALAPPVPDVATGPARFAAGAPGVPAQRRSAVRRPAQVRPASRTGTSIPTPSAAVATTKSNSES
jgi:putative flippase GtrA